MDMSWCKRAKELAAAQESGKRQQKGGRQGGTLLGGSRIPKNWKENERKAESIVKEKIKGGTRRQKIEGWGVHKAMAVRHSYRKAGNH